MMVRRAGKVVFVNRYFHPDTSATSQLLTDASTRLVARGFDVCVICSRQLYDHARAGLPKCDAIEGVRVRRVWTTAFGRRRLVGRAIDYVSFYFSAAFALVRILRSGDVVVAKTDPPLVSVPAWVAARCRGATLVNWLQDVFPEVASQLGENPLPRSLNGAVLALRDLTLRAARYNIVLGERMRRHILQRGISPASIVVAENWADIEAIQPQKMSRLRAEQRLEGVFVVGYSGNLGRAHEYRTLLGAAKTLQARPIVFLMIGGGAGMRELQREVCDLRLTNFRFLASQPRERLSDSLAAADVHLVSLRPKLEGLIVPSKFYGILAAQRPVIFVGDLEGELAQVIRSTECGRTLGEGDCTGLASVLIELQADSHLRAELARRGRRLVEARYTAEQAADKWQSILQETLAPQSAGIAVRATQAHDGR